MSSSSSEHGTKMYKSGAVIVDTVVRPETKKAAYKVVIDKGHHETTNPTPTGRDLLNLAGRTPVEQFGLYLKEKGQQPKRIGLDERVDLREPGIERFVTLPLDQTEG